MALFLQLTKLRLSVWYDQAAETITKESMRRGIENSVTFCLFLSKGVLQREFVQYEIQMAIALKKKIVLVHETDPRHGSFDFGADERKGVPEGILKLLEDVEVGRYVHWSRSIGVAASTIVTPLPPSPLPFVCL